MPSAIPQFSGASHRNGEPPGAAGVGSVITAAEMDKMTPQERADAVDAGVIRSRDEVDEDFGARVEG